MKILDFFSRNQKLIILSCLSLAALFFIDKALGVGTLLVFFLASVSLFFIGMCKESKERKVLDTLFLIVFSLHILSVIFMYYTNFQPFSGGGGDYTIYQQNAQLIAERVHQGNFSLQGIDFGNYYPVIVGYIYAFTVASMLIGQLFNAWLVALLIIFTYLIVREIGGTEKEGFLTGLIASVYPSLAFYGSLLLKDALVVLLCMIGLLLTLKIVKNFSIFKFLGFFIILTSLIHFRFYVGYALMFGFVISWFLISKINLKKRIIQGIIMVFLLGFSPQILGLGYYGFINLKNYLTVEKITFYREIVYVPVAQPQPQPQPQSQPQPQPQSQPQPQPQPKSPTKIQSQTATDSSQGRASSVVIKTGFGNPIAFAINSLHSFTFALLGPFPWQLTKMRQLLVLPEVIVWYFLIFFIVKGIIKSVKKKNKIIFTLILFSILVIGVLALFMGNFGIITRVRIPAFLALLCLFPFGLEKLKNMKIPLLNKIFNA